jgi:hypothetical protein
MTKGTKLGLQRVLQLELGMVRCLELEKGLESDLELEFQMADEKGQGSVTWSGARLEKR